MKRHTDCSKERVLTALISAVITEDIFTATKNMINS